MCLLCVCVRLKGLTSASFPKPKLLQIGRSLSAGIADLKPGLCPLPYGSHMLFLACFPCSVSRAESFVESFCGSLLALSAHVVQGIGLSRRLTAQEPSGPFPCPKGEEVLGLAKAESMCQLCPGESLEY